MPPGSIFVLFFPTLLCGIDIPLTTSNLRVSLRLRLFAYADDLAILMANL